MTWINAIKKKTQQLKPGRRAAKLARSEIAIDRLSRFPFFSASDYLKQNPDTFGIPPEVHFVKHGAAEQRQVVSQTSIARTLGKLQGKFIEQEMPSIRHKDVLTVGIFVSSLGNAFMNEIAEAVATQLELAGHSVIRGTEHSDIDSRPKNSIYVAPHEFFFLGRGPAWVRDDVLASACMFCTEQVQTQWFWKALPIVLMSKCVIDLSDPISVAFRAVMPAACICPAAVSKGEPTNASIAQHPLLSGQRWWTSNAANNLSWSERPVDVCFFGTTSPYRDQFFARHASKLAEIDGFLYLRKRQASEPILRSTGVPDLVEVARYVAQNSKVLLNIHRDEFPYFEWHRLVYQGMANGCLVLSEPCFPNRYCQAGVHYLTEEPHRLMALLDWVLNDPDGRHKASTVAAAASSAATCKEQILQGANEICRLLTQCAEA
ncbi:hypothetical protein CYG48_02375 [Neorhizobium sp. SOG26]|uniref:hypothetical protein n=1 Tax=Neorhizobium sp. SOG26 TaxID=2060726 RepID=UPI000E597A28|nr:hypothetical protein [Neorhizobium sp. SOG26]AXV14654.1 hypothetical protein CYG48_02375 [Neorhizobium sp. SOG26]